MLLYIVEDMRKGFILKKKTEQLLNGKFEYEQPQLMFSKESISITLKAGEIRKGEIYLGTEDNRKIRGYVTSSSCRLVPGFDSFSGTTVCMPYGVDCSGLAPGESFDGWLCFTTSVGEYKLPFTVQTEQEQMKTTAGEIRDIASYCAIAKNDFREAYRLFAEKSFPMILKNEGRQAMALYRGMCHQPVTYQHLEEFFIAMGQKEKVEISLKEQEAFFYDVKESTQEAFTVLRSGWGHLRLDIEVTGVFLEVNRHVITEEDFIGSSCRISYIIHRDRLGEGVQRGEIRVRSPYQQLVFPITASGKPHVKFNMSSGEKRHKIAIMKDYLEYRCGRMDFHPWAAATHYELNQLHDTGFDYPEYQLMEAYLLILEGRKEEAADILMRYQDRMFTREDLEFAGVFLYLCYMTGIYKDREQAIRRIWNFFRQKEDSLWLFLVLKQFDPELNASAPKTLFMMEELFEKGCCSPVLYLEAWEYICRDMSLLRRLGSFWPQVFLFAGKQNLLTEELSMRFAYLSGYEKTFNESLYQAMVLGYEAYPSEDALEAICKYIMKGNPRKPEYFRWFSKAVEQGLRLTRLYEYYVETMDISYQRALPKSLLMYFAYNSNTIGDGRKAYLYASVIADKKREPGVFESYRAVMKEFAVKKLSQGIINENYAVLYQEFFGAPATKEQANAIAPQTFTRRLYCDDKKIRSVIVCHSQMEQEECYPCIHGVAYPRIYTEDAVILFQDENQRRYAKTVDYNMTRLLDEREMVPAILKSDRIEPGVLLHYCETVPMSRDNLAVFERLANCGAFTVTYRRDIRKRILDYYASNVQGDDLDEYLKRLDYREYALVDKKTLLEILISRGLYTQAMAIVEEFGFEGMDERVMLKLASRQLIRCELAEDDELLSLASEIYRRGIYDEVILQYLMKYRYGPVDELFSVWKSAEGFEMDTYQIEERILGLLMLTGDYRKEGESVLASYVKHAGKERIIGAYLTQVSYGIVVKEFPISDFVQKSLKHAWVRKWPVDKICHIALLKVLSREKDPKGENMSMKKKLLKECMDEKVIFAFFRRLEPQLLSPYQLDDKTYVECHASPEAKVTLVYALDTGLGISREYKTEPMREEYEGIFVKTFTLFYGETLRYYFRIEEKGETKTTGERVLTMDKVEGNPVSKYQMINRILSARRLGKEQEVRSGMKQYLRQEQYVKEMFNINKEA